jgi:glycerol-3-phosphate dehydrogenase (NAD(P)+)
MIRSSLEPVGILGAGGMGTALGILLARGRAAVRLWCRDPGQAQEIASAGENARYLPGVPVPRELILRDHPRETLADAGLIIAAIPSAFLRKTMEEIRPFVPAGVPLLSVVKGIEFATFERPSEILREVLGDRPIAVLSGPSHAEEIARGLPASVVVASEDAILAGEIQSLLSQEAFRVYTNTDVIGVELAGALKNILGIAAGICEALGFGDNAKAALLTRGLAEISRFAVAAGGQATTFLGLAGVGDVITTCYSPYGRNRGLGLKIGSGLSLEDALRGSSAVVEGVYTTRSVHELALRRGIEMPITAQVHAILFEGKPPRSAVADLMLRQPKRELG